MLSRLLSLFLIISVFYTLSVFLMPESADRYGNIILNEKIRSFKSGIDTNTGSPASLYDQFKTTTTSYVDETRSTANQIQSTVEIKSQELQNTARSVQDAYTALEKAKTDIQKLGTFGSGSVT